jgi:SMI1 / KNR4 family (SUKH-1)
VPRLFSEDRLRAAKGCVAARGRDLRWRFNPGASEAQLTECERRIGITLPSDLRSFLNESDGAAIEEHIPGELVPDQGDHMYFLSCDGIADRTAYLRTFGRELDVDLGQFVVFVDYQDGNYVLLDLRAGHGYAIDGWHEEMAYWPAAAPLAASFTDFADKALAAMADGRNARFWIPSPPPAG